MYICLIIFFSWFEGKWRISYRIVWNCQQLQFAKKACCHCCCSHFTSTSCIGRKRWRERWNRWRRIFQETEFGKYYYSSFNAKKIFGHAFISNRWWKSWTGGKNLIVTLNLCLKCLFWGFENLKNRNHELFFSWNRNFKRFRFFESENYHKLIQIADQWSLVCCDQSHAQKVMAMSFEKIASRLLGITVKLHQANWFLGP